MSTDAIYTLIPADAEVLHMGPVEEPPRAGNAGTANHCRADILHTMGRGVFLLLHLAVCLHRYHGEASLVLSVWLYCVAMVSYRYGCY